MCVHDTAHSMEETDRRTEGRDMSGNAAAIEARELAEKQVAICAGGHDWTHRFKKDAASVEWISAAQPALRSTPLPDMECNQALLAETVD
jgi:hypothetical protein